MSQRPSFGDIFSVCQPTGHSVDVPKTKVPSPVLHSGPVDGPSQCTCPPLLLSTANHRGCDLTPEPDWCCTLRTCKRFAAIGERFSRKAATASLFFFCSYFFLLSGPFGGFDVSPVAEMQYVVAPIKHQCVSFLTVIRQFSDLPPFHQQAVTSTRTC